MTTRFNSAGFSGLLIPVLAVLIVLLGCGFKIEKASSDPPFVRRVNPGRSTVLVVPKQQPAAPVATVYPFPPGRAIFIAPTDEPVRIRIAAPGSPCELQVPDVPVSTITRYLENEVTQEEFAEAASAASEITVGLDNADYTTYASLMLVVLSVEGHPTTEPEHGAAHHLEDCIGLATSGS